MEYFKEKAMSICLSGRLQGRLLRSLGIIAVASLGFITAACGGPSKVTPPSEASTGNWQFILAQRYPIPATTLNVSGFMTEGKDGSLTGSLQVPALGSNAVCAGVSLTTGSISGQNVSLTLNIYGTDLGLTGTISTDGTSMSGDYQGPMGACFNNPTTGTWNAFLVPTLNGNFTGTITNSTYMTDLTGVSPPAPITISGTMTQSDNAGASNASLTGTINAVGYPCFADATMTGTISGQNVYLQLYGYNGTEIGTLGTPPGAPGAPPSPATVVLGSSAMSLVDSNPAGLLIGVSTSTNPGGIGPCPPLDVNSINVVIDQASLSVDF
jgi:hypothetical protein